MVVEERLTQRALVHAVCYVMRMGTKRFCKHVDVCLFLHHVCPKDLFFTSSSYVAETVKH
ncbi:hypothetical protein Hanom_Chr06g00496251 [Helianthus anomalus]